MAEETAKEPKPKAEQTTAESGKKPKKKSLWPTNCSQSNKRIRRKDWYYRNGKYFANKQCFKLYVTQEVSKKAKEKEASAATATAAAPEKAAG